MGLHKDINPMLLMKAKDTESFTITSLGHHMLWSSQLSGRIPCGTSFFLNISSNESYAPCCQKTQDVSSKARTHPQAFDHRSVKHHRLSGETPKTFYGCLLSVGKICKRKIFFHTICQCGWIQACLYLLPCMHVCKHS